MKKLSYLFVLIILIIAGCKDNVEETDISATTTESIIIWENQADLMLQINAAISYTYGLASINETETYILINDDTSSVVSKIEIKDEFKKDFQDSNPNNNSVIIELYKEEDISLDNGLSGGVATGAVTPSELCDIYETLRDGIPSFNFANVGEVCIPLSFHRHQNIYVTQTELDYTINNLNQNFSESKIQFEFANINVINNNDYYNLVVDDIPDFTEDVPGNLNVYITNSIEEGNEMFEGLANFPNQDKDRVYIRAAYFNENKDEFSAVLSHEIGHLFSLFHTFEGFLGVLQCDSNMGCQFEGDAICDTPIDNEEYGYLCNPFNSSLDTIVDNFMSYAFKSYLLKNCQRYFTEEQNIRMRFAVDYWLSNLVCQGTANSIISVNGNVDFGNVIVGQSTTQTFTITNTGDAPFYITGDNLPSGAYTTNLSSQEMAPGEVKTVTVFFTPTNAQSYDGFIEILSTAEYGSSTIPVTGAGVNPSQGSTISLNGNLNFVGNTSIGSSNTRTLTISNTGTEAFSVTGINTPTGFVANYVGTIAAGDSEDVVVTFQPTQAINYQGSVVVNNNADNGSYTISCSGTGVDNSGSSVISLSGNLNFENVDIGTSDTRTLTISNTGTESFYVSGISTSIGFSANYIGTITAGNSENITVTFQPDAAGIYQGSITVNNNADSGSSNISCSGTGVDNSGSSIISVSNSINFGNVEVGGASVEYFTISNNGTLPFTVSDINFSNSVFWTTDNAGTIASGSSVDIGVVFQPTNDQYYNETITVISNADSGSNTISLTGTGINPSGQPNIIFADYDIEEDSNNNGIVEAGEDIDFDIRLENIGNETATNIEVIISTNDSDINITDADRYYNDMPAGDLEWNGGEFNFTVSSDCPTKTVAFNVTINSDEGSWNDSFTMQVQGISTPNPISIAPSNSCSTGPLMQANTEYIVNINTANYSYGTPITGESYNGNNIRGFWLAFEVPSNWDANHDLKIYDVSSNFNPVFGIKANCNGNYLGQTSSPPFFDYINNNGYGGSETSDTNLPGSGTTGGPDDIFYVRIYHYNGNETPTISFKIIVE